MSARSIGSLTLTFGLVAIPVKLYTAISEKSVAFNFLHAKPGCGSRLGQQLVCKAENKVIERADVIRGYEYAKDQYVTFTDDEMKALEAERDDSLELLQFVPASSVDLLQVDSSKFLGPDTGGDRAYRLLSLAMVDTRRVAVGRWKTKSKDTIVIVRPYGDGGLAMHQIYYPSEVRDFGEIERAHVTLHSSELALARKLVEQLAKPTLDLSKYSDGWAEKILEAVERKVAGEEIVIPPAPAKAQAERFDLLEALQRSIGAPKKGPKKATARRAPATRARRATG